MVYTLIRLFVKSGDDSKRRKHIGILCGCVNVVCNLLLFVSKLAVGILSGSVAVTADAFNNLSDTASSMVTITGFQLSQRAPDRKHPFGYGRFEYVAGVVVSVLVLTVGVEFIKSSIEKIITPQAVGYNNFMIFLLVAAILVKLWMGYANMKFAKAMGGSSTLKATAVDSIIDVATTSVALLSLILSRYLDFPIDGYLGLVVAVAVLVAGFRILTDTVSPLLGQSAPPELVEKIRDFILEYDEIIGVHDIVLHNYGPVKIIATLHAEVPVDSDIIHTHEVIDRAEREIGERLGITLLVHLDPIVTDDERVNQTRKIVKKCLEELDPDYDMHDFRMVDGKEQINLVFDVLVQYGLKKSDDRIKQEIAAALRGVDSRFNAVITVDKSFIG